MKLKIAIIAMMGISIGINAQTYNENVLINGKLSVVDNPGSNGEIIHVRNNIATGTNQSFGGIKFSSAPGFDWVLGKFSDGVTGKFQIRDQANTERLTILPSGYVGIGTNIPSSLLHIKSNDRVFFNVESDKWADIVIKSNNTSQGYYSSLNFMDENDRGWGISQTPEGNLRFNNNISGSYGEPEILISPNGAIGLGTTTTGTHKLAVEGSIGAREIKVEANGWSDFVFHNDYNLRPLNEVESFIEQNNHLPDIPSEKEVKEKGINLGDMDAKLLQKIEELTLYMIKQNKQMKAMSKKNLELQKRIEELEKK